MDIRIIGRDMIKALAPARPETGHKGTFGTCTVIAGNCQMTGAQTLTVSAALRSGTGIVRAYAPAGSLVSTRVNCPSAVISVFPDSTAAVVREELKRAERVSCYAIGPGCDEKDPGVIALLVNLMPVAKGLVIDASALRILSADRKMLDGLKARYGRGMMSAVLTPHAGEFKALAGEEASRDTDARAGQALSFARESGTVLVLKDSDTVIATPAGDLYLMKGGNSGMSKGGSGDVLTGLIAGFIAQGMEAADAACAAVFFHQDAGSIAASHHGERFMQPTDVIDSLGESYKKTGW